MLGKRKDRPVICLSDTLGFKISISRLGCEGIACWPIKIPSNSTLLTLQHALSLPHKFCARQLYSNLTLERKHSNQCTSAMSERRIITNNKQTIHWSNVGHKLLIFKEFVAQLFLDLWLFTRVGCLFISFPHSWGERDAMFTVSLGYCVYGLRETNKYSTCGQHSIPSTIFQHPRVLSSVRRRRCA